jgi:hypothetical protein
MRLDEEKLEALRHWGRTLRTTPNEAFAAAGRAILLLLEEIDRLGLELERTRAQLRRDESASSDATAVENLEDPVTETLQGRLQRALGRNAASSPDPESAPGDELSVVETEEPTPSAQSWIEAHRRQK